MVLASRTDTLSVRPRQLLIAFVALAFVLVAVIGVAAWRREPAVAGYGFCTVVGCWGVVVARSARDWFVHLGVLRPAARIVAVLGWVAVAAFVWFVLMVSAVESFGLLDDRYFVVLPH
jgi:hypothetical protein